MKSSIKINDVVFRKDLYPRMITNPQTVQKYADDLSVLPPIIVNQHNELIDGWHRWVTMNLAKRANIPCYVVLYKLSNYYNPVDKRFQDITSFRIKRLHPHPESNWRTITPSEWAEALLSIRKFGSKKVDELLVDYEY